MDNEAFVSEILKKHGESLGQTSSLVKVDGLAVLSTCSRDFCRMNNSKIDSLIDQIIDKHKAQKDARRCDADAKTMQAIEFIVIAVIFSLVIFAFWHMLFFI